MINTKQLGIAIIIALILIIISIMHVNATPVEPKITITDNSTQYSEGTESNLTGGAPYNPEDAGGFIFTVNMDARSQDNRWKAYVGNVTKIFRLAKNANTSIYDWQVHSTLAGEIYATRTDQNILWSNITCSTASNITNEEIALNHTFNVGDKISVTFDAKDNKEFYVGTVKINSNSCYTTNTFVNSSAPSNDEFEEVLLHDGTNMVYATMVENDKLGYRGQTGETFDFQMIVPESAVEGWNSITLYYFYSEIA